MRFKLTTTDLEGRVVLLRCETCEPSPVCSAKSDLDNVLRQWNVGRLGIILDISVVQLVVLRPSRSVVVSSNLIHARILILNLIFNTFGLRSLIFEEKNEPYFLENASNLTHEFCFAKEIVKFYCWNCQKNLMCQT